MTSKGNAVLVVEDDQDMRGMVELTLTGAGFRVVTAGEGREALDQVAHEMPRVILLDMRMPGMNGWEFAREFHAKYGNRASILVVSAAQSAQERAKEIGADGFLDKPFEIDELIRLTTAMFAQPETEDPNEDDLVALSKQGDQDAFVKLYDRYYDRIYRHIVYRVSRVEDAEDLTQQVFLRAWGAVGRYEQRGSPFLAWLFTIAHNLIVSSYRKKPSFYMKDDLPDGRADSDPEHQADLHWERERLLEAILRLTPVQQKIITMRFLENRDYHQIAAIVGKSEVNVRVIQYRALQQLRRILTEDDD